MTRGALWWAKCVVHNCLVHPMLPLADLLDTLGEKRVSKAVFWLHDHTAPTGGG